MPSISGPQPLHLFELLYAGSADLLAYTNHTRHGRASVSDHQLKGDATECSASAKHRSLIFLFSFVGSEFL